MAMTSAGIATWFNYNRPTEEQVEKMEKMRKAARDFAVAIVENTPISGDQVLALRGVKTTLMAANAALVSPLPK